MSAKDRFEHESNEMNLVSYSTVVVENSLARGEIAVSY